MAVKAAGGAGDQVRRLANELLDETANKAIRDYQLAVEEIPWGPDYDHQQRYRQIQFAMVDDMADLKAEILRMGRECYRFNAGLPMYSYQHEIMKTISESQVSIVVGDTGSGKSTQVCQYLYEHGFANGNHKIICTQPRKVAATSLAERVSTEMKTALGNLVGYQVGMKGKVSNETKIVFSTDHCLLNECLKDRLFLQYSVLVIDEAHERSIFTDLLLGLIKKCLPQRPDLKVIITSATIDPAVFQKYFGECPVVRVPGRMYPVDVSYSHGSLPSANEYLQFVLDCVKQLHAEKEPGDILAFLVTPLDCERGTEELADLADAVCFPLHGQLSAEKYAEVMAPITDGRRKVVLATNCAETSITIPGIKYVVDCGLAKEKQFDPKVNVSKLVICGISKSSADQRKGRAGRVESGECIRLYSEHDYQSMEEIAVPEILRVNLGQAVLSLIALGIKDPLSFDFVQSPDKQSLKSAHELLKSLGCLDIDGGLNDIGKKMVHLPVDPKFAKFILLCCDHGVGYKDIAMAAMCIQGNMVFYRGSTDEEKVAADAKKAKFLDKCGDSFTFLKLFASWQSQPAHNRGQWCFENSINAKLMKNAYSLVKELRKCLNRQLNIKVEEEALLLDNLEVIEKNYLACFFPNNLCFFSGFDRVGYFVPQVQKYCPLHPSSTLSYCGEAPKIAIFENILETSRKYLISVSKVDQVNYNYGGGWLNETYITQLVGQFPLSKAGPAIQRDLYYTRRAIKNEMKDVFAHCLLVPDLLWSPPKQNSLWVNLIVRHSDYQLVNEYIQTNFVAPLIDAARMKKKEVGVDGKSDVKVYLGAGGKVCSCVMPDEFISVKIVLKRACDASLLENQQVSELLSGFGEIIKIEKVEQQATTWGFVEFCQPSSAAQAVARDFPLFHCLKSHHRPQTATEEDGFRGSITVEWLRRPSKEHAFVKLPPGLLDEHLFTVASFSLGFTTCTARRNKKDYNNLFLKPVPKDCTDKMILDNMPSFLRACNPNIIIPSEPAFQEIELDHQAIKALLQPSLQASGLTLASVKFLNDRETCRIVRCFIQMGSIASCLKFLDSLELCNLHHQCRPLKFIASWTYLFKLPVKVYDFLEKDITQRATLLGSTTQFRVEPKFKKVGTLNCRSNDHNNLKRLQTELSQIIYGVPFDCGGTLSRSLLTGKHDEMLKKVMDQTGVLIEKDARQDRLNLYGGLSNTVTAQGALIEFLEILGSKNHLESVFPLKGGGKPPGLMKLLLRKYKVDLHELNAIEGSVSVRLDLRKHEIQYLGTSDAYHAIQAELDKLEKEAVDRNRSRVETQCPVCLDEVEEDKVQLSLCGHHYCKECFNDWMKSTIKNKSFPLCCTAEDCNEFLCIDDISITNDVINASVESFVARNKEYEFCPTPDCPNIYHATEISQTYHCSMCFVRTCTRCHKNAHLLNEACSADPDSNSIGRWMEEDPENRKKCPGCGFGIEKNEGCFRMSCTKCNAHFCWNCLTVYPSISAVYGHNCPGRAGRPQ
ncbi:uncharacterized protein [Watersipora subatra]|uniref:uncharacterized protein isoform X2 n=1 Tax=Watersipora subatra TaxID=2589382 RepID=UPI00355C576D